MVTSLVVYSEGVDLEHEAVVAHPDWLGVAVVRKGDGIGRAPAAEYLREEDRNVEVKFCQQKESTENLQYFED